MFPARPSDSQRGVVLVLTLVVVVVITILTISFISAVSEDLNATSSYSQVEKAEQIARGGLDTIVAMFLSEIADSAYSDNVTASSSATTAAPLYRPVKSSNILSSRMISPSAATTNIVKLSSNGVSFCPGNTASIYSSLASPASTTNYSLNRRRVSPTRWNKPQFVPAAYASQFPAPDWVLVNRSGPKVATVFSSSLSDSLGGNNSVIGRYAYVVYDTSGLIDINAAGFPSASTDIARNKGPLSWVDLTVLGVSTPDVDAFVSWRNAASLTSGYAAAVGQMSTNGFASVLPGDTVFLSRQDLLQYATNTNPDFQSILPYLTTFSREQNGPTWGPVTPTGSSTNYSSLQYVSNTLNPFILNPRVKKSFTRNNGLTAVVGEPLVKYRFPLEKLALLEKLSGTSSLTAQDIDDIARYFGLDAQSDSNGYYRHWSYPTTNSKYLHTSGSILNLDQIASLSTPREPDFFELLQAGILSGSLGKTGRGDIDPNRSTSTTRWTWYGSSLDTDRLSTLQILRIGTNIIDQWDSDNYPTTITYVGPSIDVYGIEDLPAISQIYVRSVGDGTTSNVAPPWTFYLYCQLWNPHQNNSTTSSPTPTDFQIAPLSGSVGADNSCIAIGINGYNSTWWYWNPDTASWSNSGTHYLNADGNQVLPFKVTSTDFREPAILTTAYGGTAANASTLQHGAGYVPTQLISASSPILAWNLGKVPSLPVGITSSTLPSTIFSTSMITSTNYVTSITTLSAALRIQYKDQGGTYRTYSTFAGPDSNTLFAGWTTSQQYGAYVPSATMSPAIAVAATTQNTPSSPKSDPRTYRFGAAYAYNGGTTNLVGTVSGVLNIIPSVRTLLPFPSGATSFVASVPTSAPYRFDYWAVNDTASVTIATGGANPCYADNDGVMRFGDTRDAFKTSSLSPHVFNATSLRPVILNRPFQSVGDIGYAFRDLPWKTIDLYSSTSADAALLDLFCLNGNAPIVSGRINPNTASPLVLAAMIQGATRTGNGISATSTTLSSSVAQTVAQSLNTFMTATPLQNRAELASSLNATLGASLPIKTEREAVIRALAESSNLRTWNFFIDIIAQSGKYPASAKTLNDFVVEGERRYWLHIAIDRFTGQVIDRQLEIVDE